MALLDLSRTGVSTRTTPGHIYFVQAETGGLIKIGWATSPTVRMAHMQAHSPVRLRILYSEPGNGADEAALHRKFAAERQHGEWFEPSPALSAHIEERRAAPQTVYVAAPIAPYVFKGRKPPPPGRPRQRPTIDPE